MDTCTTHATFRWTGHMIKYGAFSFQPIIKLIFRNAMQTKTIYIFSTTIQQNNLWITSIYHV